MLRDFQVVSQEAQRNPSLAMTMISGDCDEAASYRYGSFILHKQDQSPLARIGMYTRIVANYEPREGFSSIEGSTGEGFITYQQPDPIGLHWKGWLSKGDPDRVLMK